MKKIVQDGAAVLRGKAAEVPETLFGSEELSRIIVDMAETLDREDDGVALAAPQIALPYRIFIVRRDRTLPHTPIEGSQTLSRSAEVDTYINPKIIRTSRRRSEAEEGCLSVRGIYGITKRHERVTVRAQREDGTYFERGGGGLLAQIFEHEIDHLNGILFTDNAVNLVHAAHPATTHEHSS